MLPAPHPCLGDTLGTADPPHRPPSSFVSPHSHPPNIHAGPFAPRGAANPPETGWGIVDRAAISLEQASVGPTAARGLAATLSLPWALCPCYGAPMGLHMCMHLCKAISTHAKVLTCVFTNAKLPAHMCACKRHPPHLHHTHMQTCSMRAPMGQNPLGEGAGSCWLWAEALRGAAPTLRNCGSPELH